MKSSFKKGCLLYFIVKSLFFSEHAHVSVFDSVSHFYLIKKRKENLCYSSLVSVACITGPASRQDSYRDVRKIRSVFFTSLLD